MQIDLVSHLVSAAIRAFVPCLFAFAGMWLFRIRSPATRHATWTVVLAGMLLQIPLGFVAPAIPLKTLPKLPPPMLPRTAESARIPELTAHTLAIASPTRAGTKRMRVSPGGALTGIYLAISMLLFVRMGLGYWSLRRILRDASPIPDLGPGIFESALFVAPGSVGCFRGRVFLPQAWKDWDAAKLRAVLAHERAHIRRQDCLIRVASHVNACIFWFHPLAWWLEREIARLAEEACDDVAVSTMQDSEEYAAALVDIARAAAVADRRILNWSVISMASDSNVIRRVNRILETGLQVPKPLGRLAWVMLLACSVPVIYMSAAVTLAAANRGSTVLVEQATVPVPPVEAESAVGPVAQVAPIQPVMPALPENPPIALCILIDNSGSMRAKREAVKAAALALVRASKPGDEVSMVDFNDEVDNDLPFTGNVREMEEALTHIDSRGGSAMREAVRISIDQIEQAAHNAGKVLVLVTDGDDNASAITQEQLLSKVRNSGVRVYSIALLNRELTGDRPGRAEAARLELGQLAEASGGMVYYPADLAEVEAISPEVANELRKR